MTSRLFTFLGGDTGPWRIRSMATVMGAPLDTVARVDVSAGAGDHPEARWRLRGIASNDRYITRSEKERLVSKQEGLGRTGSTCAALIPIRKNAAWWALTQDERRAVFEESSHHVAIGLRYLPAIARRLHHCRDLSAHEPFDFLTWFEYAPADVKDFEELVRALRATEEWKYVEREIDIRLERD